MSEVLLGIAEFFLWLGMGLSLYMTAIALMDWWEIRKGRRPRG